MDQTIHALKSKHNVLLELPTGSGKSLSLICAASAWIESAEKEMLEGAEVGAGGEKKTDSCMVGQESGCGGCAAGSSRPDSLGSALLDTSAGTVELEARVSVSKVQIPAGAVAAGEDDAGGFLPDQQMMPGEGEERSNRPPRVYFASRTHSQIGQLIREMRKTVYRPKMCVLGSREHYCIDKEVAKSTSKGEDCKERLRDNTCNYFHNVQKLASHKELASRGQMEVHDIEGGVISGSQTLCRRRSVQSKGTVAPRAFSFIFQSKGIVAPKTFSFSASVILLRCIQLLPARSSIYLV